MALAAFAWINASVAPLDLLLGGASTAMGFLATAAWKQGDDSPSQLSSPAS